MLMLLGRWWVKEQKWKQGFLLGCYCRSARKGGCGHLNLGDNSEDKESICLKKGERKKVRERKKK